MATGSGFVGSFVNWTIIFFFLAVVGFIVYTRIKELAKAKKD